MCVMGDCGKYGRCYQFFSGGNMFSTCTCYAGRLCIGLNEGRLWSAILLDPIFDQDS